MLLTVPELRYCVIDCTCVVLELAVQLFVSAESHDAAVLYDAGGVAVVDQSYAEEAAVAFLVAG